MCKRYILGRKNWLFNRNEEGAKTTSILETLVNIAYQNNIDPQEYISYLLDHIEELKD